MLHALECYISCSHLSNKGFVIEICSLSPSVLLQVHNAVGQTPIWNHQLEGDVQVYQRGALFSAILPVASGQAVNRQPARQDPRGQTQPRPHSEARLLHTG